jgi:tRNA A-37 threonylcarbamoyl transferase component Bud32
MEFHYVRPKMLNFVSFPSAYVQIKSGAVSLLLKEEYKDLLRRMGIEDLESFLKKHGQTSPHLVGRIPHFSVPLEDGKKMVIRRYAHGGWLRFFTRDLYFSGSRSFQELFLTEEIRSAGISTVQPIGAIRRRVFLLFYKAYFLSLELPKAEDSRQFLQRIGFCSTQQVLLKKRETIRSTGRLVQRFHKSGFFHRDLQLKNILIVEDQPYLIDFDRSYRREALPLKKRIQNLLRLNRSVEKWRNLGLPLTKTDRWRFFRAYSGEDPQMRKVLKSALHAYSVRFFFHHCFWKLSEVLKGRSLAG